MRPGRLLLAALAAAAVAGCAGSVERAGDSALALRGIMRDMGREVAAIAEGLMQEDYARVEAAALRVASHPQPPVEERARIITWLGARAAGFRGRDAEANRHAQAVAAAARSRDAGSALAAFTSLQSACNACHAEFRRPLLEKFYGL